MEFRNSSISVLSLDEILGHEHIRAVFSTSESGMDGLTFAHFRRWGVQKLLVRMELQSNLDFCRGNQLVGVNGMSPGRVRWCSFRLSTLRRGIDGSCASALLLDTIYRGGSLSYSLYLMAKMRPTLQLLLGCRCIRTHSLYQSTGTK